MMRLRSELMRLLLYRAFYDQRHSSVMSELARDAFIDGQWTPGRQRFAVLDPFDDAPIEEVTDCDEALVDQAVEAAARAFPIWRRRPGPERGKLLAAMAQRMLADERALALLCTRENGKAFKE